MSQTDRSSSAEDVFVEIFQEAVGFHGAQSLQFQLPCSDIDGSLRSIDYALISPYGRYAFEIDGEIFHDPGSPLVSPEKHRDGLRRQNSLIYLGWRFTAGPTTSSLRSGVGRSNNSTYFWSPR